MNTAKLVRDLMTVGVRRGLKSRLNTWKSCGLDPTARRGFHELSRDFSPAAKQE